VVYSLDLLRCMSPEMAHLRHQAMSALRSLSGVKRTSIFSLGEAGWLEIQILATHPHFVPDQRYYAFY
jgi:hypothetical protein